MELPRPKPSVLFSHAHSLAVKYRFQIAAFFLIALWCVPYFTTGSKIEWGDFGVFTQGYEAIRISVLQYHQFPWFDPWIAGGVPLFANPQIGVFSLQTILVLIFGASVGLKLSLVIYTFLGYISMYVLARRYFHISEFISVLLGLIWLFCSFFVSHLPSHYTFLWFMLAPLFVYLTLTMKDVRTGMWLGLAFAVMGLSQLHYSFFQIAVVCAAIVLVRLLVERNNRKQLLLGMAAAAFLFLVLCAPRLILTAENVHDFPREIALADPSAGLTNSLLSILLPVSYVHTRVRDVITYPMTQYGWGEQTMSIGISASIAVLLAVLYYLYSWKLKKSGLSKNYRVQAFGLLALGLFFFILGVGAIQPYSPYALIKHLPVFSDMRVSSRWFLWGGLSMLIFVGTVASRAPKKSFFRFGTTALLLLAVFELFALNFGYQSKVLVHPIVHPPHAAHYYTFEQEGVFGQELTLPDNKGQIPHSKTLPHFYREYEATMYNLGTLQANDALVDLNTISTPRCGREHGCGLVLSHNATVITWTPNKLVLKRTGSGPIELNENASNYFLINGRRDGTLRVAEPYERFLINTPDAERTITIKVAPDFSLQRVLSALKN